MTTASHEGQFTGNFERRTSVGAPLQRKEEAKGLPVVLDEDEELAREVYARFGLFESVAIAIHLGETFGVERGLFPAPGAARAEALKWLVWCNVSLGEATSRFIQNTSDRVPAELRNEKAGALAKEDVARLLRTLNAALEKKSYLMGEAFSIVDAHLASWIEFLGIIGIDVSPFAAISAWAKRCGERPAAKVQ